MTAPPDLSSNRRLTKALAHVNNLWFPFNPAVLTQLENGFKEGTFSKDGDDLLNVLKQDFALFTYLIKELIPVASGQHVTPRIMCNPVELLKWAGPEKIRSIVFSDKGLPSAHSLNNSEGFQAARLRETAIVATTAEVLSEKKKLDPNFGFCRGVLREIGLNLIAWNYPLLYSRIMKAVPENSSLEEELTRELGFSPSVLAMRIITPSNVNMDSPEVTSINKELAVYDDLCEVGEALAQADNPSVHPQAARKWAAAQQHLEQAGGPEVLATIQSRAVSNSKSYSAEMDSAFPSPSDFNPEKRLATHRQAIRVTENRYVRYCSEEVRDAIQALYAAMPADVVDRAILERLIKEVIPKAGFTGGCVFVMNPSEMTLTPRTVIGKVRGRAISTIALRPLTVIGLDLSFSETEIIEAATDHEDAIANAFACVQPIIEQDREQLNEGLTLISSSLGGRRRIGVLYLEKPLQEGSEPNNSTLATFKALRQALCDALHIE